VSIGLNDSTNFVNDIQTGVHIFADAFEGT
jgi:hypothetical protein